MPAAMLVDFNIFTHPVSTHPVSTHPVQVSQDSYNRQIIITPIPKEQEPDPINNPSHTHAFA